MEAHYQIVTPRGRLTHCHCLERYGKWVLMCVLSVFGNFGTVGFEKVASLLWVFAEHRVGK